MPIDFTDRDIYILRHLQSCKGRFPLSNLVCGAPIPAVDLVKNLKRLESAGMLRLKGRLGLDDVAKAVEKNSPIDPPRPGTVKGSWIGTNTKAFHNVSDKDRIGFFSTQVCLTLRARWALRSAPPQPRPEQVMAKPL
ncbi:MAG: hypothetical protein OXT65_12310 [Alphaproteobacteria bacterium]|nr:hypothetical protein [Alphaproteobacteria bacterium]